MHEENSSSFDLLSRSTINSVWGALTMEVMARLGVETIVISPGSRSTPLALAASRNPRLEAISILDERTAGFFALGLAKRTHRPVALVCTSGSAVANYYPATLEASMSGTPLLLLTADRPSELRDCSEGQTIDQIKIFGSHVRFFHEVALPDVKADLLAYLRQTLAHALQQSLQGNPGPVHLNFPFREPLCPEPGQPPVVDLKLLESAAIVTTRICEAIGVESGHFDLVALERLSSHRHGLIVVGTVNPHGDDASFAKAMATISQKLGWPVLSDVLNPLRGYLDECPALVCHYDTLLRDRKIAEEWKPSAVLQVGSLPTSKTLRAWLGELDAVSFLLSDRPVNTDPLHRISVHLQGSAEALNHSITPQSIDPEWLKGWLRMEQQIAATVCTKLEQANDSFEGKIAWILSRCLPGGTSVFIANSMSVRYAEYFWCAGNKKFSIHCNRGTNGIDGTLGTAMGMAHRGNPAVLLTGDLAFLHDTNALLTVGELKGSLTVVLANNQGGGIFEHLPVSRMKDSFERYFATPQNVQFDALCQAYGVQYQQVRGLDALIESISALPARGVRLLEVPIDRRNAPSQLSELFNNNQKPHAG